MEDCLFCKISAGTIPAFKIYEDDDFIAFLDIFPRAKGHALVIPKKHYRWVYDVPNFGEYWEVSKKVALAVQQKTNASFISFFTMGEEVPHAHIHIIPQYEGKHSLKLGEVQKMSDEEIQQLAEEIKSF